MKTRQTKSLNDSIGLSTCTALEPAFRNEKHVRQQPCASRGSPVPVARSRCRRAPRLVFAFGGVPPVPAWRPAGLLRRRGGARRPRRSARHCGKARACSSTQPPGRRRFPAGEAHDSLYLGAPGVLGHSVAPFSTDEGENAAAPSAAAHVCAVALPL